LPLSWFRSRATQGGKYAYASAIIKTYDALHENRASVHVGKGSQNDHNDAKIWLEPKIEIARSGKTLRTQELTKALKIIEQDLEYLLEEYMVAGTKQTN
jgi:hypothetical protein